MTTREGMSALLEESGDVIYVHINSIPKKQARKDIWNLKAQTKKLIPKIYSIKGSKERCSKNNTKKLDLKLQGIH